MYKDVGMAMQNTTESKYMDGSMETRQSIQEVRRQPCPYICLVLITGLEPIFFVVLYL